MNTKSTFASVLIALTLTAPLTISVSAAPGVAVKPQTVTPATPKVNAPAETGLIEIARGRGLNVLIDSSAIDPTAPIDALEGIPRGPEGNVVNVVAHYMEQRHLSAEQLSPDTFVFWAEPDQDKMVEAILKGEGFGAETETQTPDELLLALRLQLDPAGAKQELAAIQGAAARPQTPQEKIALRLKLQDAAPTMMQWSLSQLPVNLQQPLVAKVIQSSLDDSLLPDNLALWARDEVWQQARIWYRPAQPRQNQDQTLVMQTQVENQQNRLLLSFFPSAGVGSAEIMRDAQGAPLPVTAGLSQGQVRVLPFSLKPGDAPAPATAPVLEMARRPAGAGLKSLQAMAPSPLDFGAQTGFEATVSLDAVRQPLAAFLRGATPTDGVRLLVGPELEATAPLISAHLQQMPLAQLMQIVAYTYGAKWTKGEAQTYTLNRTGRSPFEMELLRVGKLTWYRSRDIVVPVHERQVEAFNTLAARVFDEAGDAIATQPGVLFTALPGETQAELRQMAKARMARRFLRREIRVRDSMSGQWSFRLVGGASRSIPPMLTLFSDGRPAANLMWSSPVATANPAPLIVATRPNP